MVHIKRVVEPNNFNFTEGWIPTMEEITKSQPRQSPQLRELFGYGEEEIESHDEFVAWTMSMLARRYVKYRFSIETAKKARIETIVIGPPNQPDSVFADWFIDSSPAYRLLIHREPVLSPDGDQYGFFGQVYRANRIGFKQKLKGVAGELRRPVEAFLGKLGLTYNQDQRAIDSLLRGTGHSYCCSDGLAITATSG